MLLLDK